MPLNAAFTTVPIFLFILPDQPLYIVKNVCVCVCVHVCVYVYIYIHIHTSDCVLTVYKLPLLPNNNASVTFLHKLGPVRRVEWIFIIGPDLLVTGQICEIVKKIFTISSSKRK